MRLYQNTSEAVINSLTEIFESGKYADKVIEKTLKLNKKWGSRDRKFIAETTYEIVRWWRYLKYIANIGEVTKRSEYYQIFGTWLVSQGVQLPAWEEFRSINPKKVARMNKEEFERKIQESIPDWLDELGEQELGLLWPKEIKALNEQAKVFLRINSLKTTKKMLVKAFNDREIETENMDGFPDALQLIQRQNIFLAPEFKEGLFELQDASSQLIGPFMRLEPGMRVIDACAGGGGKSLHIAALMKNKGRIIAMDVEQWKLNELKKRAKRAGATNIEPRLIDSSKVIKRLINSADRLLLDVPCSGIGVLKRNPDAKWKLNMDFIDKVKQAQETILNDYCYMVKPDGVMVYSTCSILPTENSLQVKKFLENHPNFEFLEEKSILPSSGFDGFYMAALRRLS